MSNVLVWFKNDLRLHDNETLVKAIASGKKVLPVYCFDPKLYRNTELDFPKSDAVRFEFAKQCVENLRENLMNIGGNLMVAIGEPEQLLPELAERYHCESIYTEEEFATEELKILEDIKKRLPKNFNLHFTWGHTLYHKEDIQYAIEEIPLTSKAFRIQTQKSAAVRPTFVAPERMETIDVSNADWGILPEATDAPFALEQNFALTYMEGGESKAMKRLQHYFFETEDLTHYRWTRNRSLGLEYSSKFSPYLATGCISPRTIYEAVKRYEQDIKKNQSTWWLIFEMVWRDYFTFKLMRFQNKVFLTEGYTDKHMTFTNDEVLFKRWCQGQTGIPFIDAHMRQLNETGYMSNRGRVNCSSFLVYDYQVDWTWGAAYFESKLIDYDVASNWMNWHTQAYQIWYTNAVHQANKYKAQEFIRKWVPELRELNDRDILIPWEVMVADYPKPHTVFKKWTRAINKIRALEI